LNALGSLAVLTEDLRYKLLKLLAEEPQISQRDLAGRLGVSVGKTNYCLSALVDKGLVKINNFRRANNKLAYAYLLTPRGIEEKARVTVSFLQRKMREYAELSEEIEALRRETRVSGAEDKSGDSTSVKRHVVGEVN
jgi:EPS-associated MarR family transcriptional regulator